MSELKTQYHLNDNEKLTTDNPVAPFISVEINGQIVHNVTEIYRVGNKYLIYTIEEHPVDEVIIYKEIKP